MAEAIGVTDTVTVEVVRASPFGATATGGTAITAESAIIVVGVVVALALIILGVKKYYGVSRKYGGKTSATPVRRGFLKSLGLAALFGFVGFFLSGSALSWVLATGIFYYEFVMRRGE